MTEQKGGKPTGPREWRVRTAATPEEAKDGLIASGITAEGYVVSEMWVGSPLWYRVMGSDAQPPRTKPTDEAPPENPVS